MNNLIRPLSYLDFDKLEVLTPTSILALVITMMKNSNLKQEKEDEETGNLKKKLVVDDHNNPRLRDTKRCTEQEKEKSDAPSGVDHDGRKDSPNNIMYYFVLFSKHMGDMNF